MLIEKETIPSWLSFLVIAALIDAVCTTPIATLLGIGVRWQIGISLFGIIAILLWLLTRSPPRHEEEPAE